MACPYGVRYFNEELGVVEKCTLCSHLLERGESPRCVRNCIASARYFGDIDDPNSEISQKIKEAGNNAHMLADVGNRPSNRYILSKATWRSG